MLAASLPGYISQAVRPGINITGEAYQSNSSFQLLSGKMLREGWLPLLLQKESSLDPVVLEEVKNQYPYIWQRLIHILSFGYNTGKVLHGLLDDNELRIRYSCHTAALFNLIISIYDYLLDEYASKENAGAVSHQLISGLLVGDTRATLSAIRKSNETIKDPLLQLLLSSIYTWIVYTQFVYAEHKCRDKKLYPYILQLFEAEKKTIQCNNDNPVIDILHTKSAGPFIAIGKFISEITPGGTMEQHDIFESIVNDIGNTFWIADDLSDIQKDFDNRTPNSILIRSGNIDYDEPLTLNTSLKHAINDAVKDLLAGCRTIKENAALLCKDACKTIDVEEYLNMNIAGWLKLYP